MHRLITVDYQMIIIISPYMGDGNNGIRECFVFLSLAVEIIIIIALVLDIIYLIKSC